MNKRLIAIASLGMLSLVAIQFACTSRNSPHAETEVRRPSRPAQPDTAEVTRQQGISELRRIHGALDELRIVTEGGISAEEFSRRFADALLKVGDLEMSRQRTLAQFPEAARSSVVDVYTHFQNAIEAFRESKRFFGGAGTGAAESEYSRLKQRFPQMPEVQSESDSVMSDHRYYPAPGILNALWVSAVQENRIAAESIASMDQHR